MSDENTVRGRMCTIPALVKTSSQSVKTLREQTLQVNGCKLFNILPYEVKNMKNCDVISFKDKLDVFLTNIPDNPVIEDLTPSICDPMTGKPILFWTGYHIYTRI